MKNVFLHVDLEKEIYIEEEIKGNWVSKLKKTLYGLKQSPIAWFGKVTKVMLDMEYKKS